MSTDKNTQDKERLHLRNRNRERYDLNALKIAEPELANHIKPNKYGDDSVDFANPEAVKLLNKALLSHYYGIKNWDFPAENLCPPIPGRADYLHYMADLLDQSNFGTVPNGDQVTVLDIGVGASCIYPVIGVTEYGWKFIGSDIDPQSLESAKKIVEANASLQDKIECRLQEDPEAFFSGIITGEEKIDMAICNPPFHSTPEEAKKGSRRKVQNLSGKKTKTPELNFAGIGSELICEGGESAFIQKMVRESKAFATNFYWFSTLVSKQSNLKGIYKILDEMEITQIKTLPLGTGNKSSRVIAWSFLTKEEQKEWRETRWRVKEEK
ncbi:23S rRNA (adenine(1618)-N(6))-methyltransferase RlmF [Chryseobacterium sp.]|uniref:23S rRNA (adenine(1618)-N(6))-methyltransferase RlmF n=1 Tax=Chryseobacterium sp. TaxID=1871047 RepID=UPI0011C7E8E4|nr:23S rRNA (adenine(1618)-N(6))-methyltransferase RlmF [Chryseobacterium sp.]TXF78977.1 23S rRNA (adenine(1618)-N(6))-methyltransferase RlmF [Chryseobacterium sp.]